MNHLQSAGIAEGLLDRSSGSLAGQKAQYRPETLAGGKERILDGLYQSLWGVFGKSVQAIPQLRVDAGAELTPSGLEGFGLADAFGLAGAFGLASSSGSGGIGNNYVPARISRAVLVSRRLGKITKLSDCSLTKRREKNAERKERKIDPTSPIRITVRIDSFGLLRPNIPQADGRTFKSLGFRVNNAFRRCSESETLIQSRGCIARLMHSTGREKGKMP